MLVLMFAGVVNAQNKNGSQETRNKSGNPTNPETPPAGTKTTSNETTPVDENKAKSDVLPCSPDNFAVSLASTPVDLGNDLSVFLGDGQT